MNFKFNRNIDNLAFCLHPEKSVIFYLIRNPATKYLNIIEESIYDQMIYNTYSVPKEVSSQGEIFGFNLVFCKQKQYLALSSRSSYLIIWNTVNQQQIFKTVTKGKDLYIINMMIFSDFSSNLFFSVKGKDNLYSVNIQAIIGQNKIKKYRKFKIPNTIINDIRPYPKENETYMAIACSDGNCLIWDHSSRKVIIELYDPFEQMSRKKSNIQQNFKNAVTCISFSNDGNRLLMGTQKGKIFSWICSQFKKSSNLYNILEAQIHISELGILSLSWNEDLLDQFYFRKFLLFFCYTAEGALKLFQISYNNNAQSQNASLSPSNNQAQMVELDSIFNVSLGDTQIYDLKAFNFCLNNMLQVHNISSTLFFQQSIININKQNFIVPQHSFQKLNILYYLQDKYFSMNQSGIVTSKNYTYSCEELFEDKPVFNNDIFYADNISTDIIRFKLSNGNKSILFNLRDYLGINNQEHVKILKIQVRPLSNLTLMENSGIINVIYRQGCIEYCLIYNIENPNFKQCYKCSQSLLLGKYNLVYPLLLLFHEDKKQLSLIRTKQIDYEEPIQQKFLKLNTNIKIQCIYNTPFREGYAILYQTLLDNNILRYSSNIKNENNQFDFTINNEIIFKTDFDDTILEVQWNNPCSFQSMHVGVILCWTKLYFVQQNLSIIQIVDLQSASCEFIPFSYNIFWFGPCAIFSNQYHTFYITYNFENQFQQNSSMNILYNDTENLTRSYCITLLLDRIIQIQQKFTTRVSGNKKNANITIQCREYNPLELLITGLINVNKKLFDNQFYQKDTNIIKVINHCFQTFNPYCISQHFLQTLIDNNLEKFAMFLCKNEKNRHFSVKQKLQLLNQTLKFNYFYSFLFPEQNIDDPLVLSQIKNQILFNPNFSLHKMLIKNQINIFLIFQQYLKAAQCCELLQDYNFIIQILIWENLKKEAHDLNQKIQQQISQEPFKIILDCEMFNKKLLNDNNNLKNILNQWKNNYQHLQNQFPINLPIQINPQQINKWLEILNDNEFDSIQSKQLSFGEKAFTQYFSYGSIQQKQQDQEYIYQVQKEQQEYFIFESLEKDSFLNILGYNTIKEESHQKENIEITGTEDDFLRQNQDIEKESDEEFEEEDEEKILKHLVLYWRFDEGKGNQIEDMSNQNIQGQIQCEKSSCEDCWEVLQDGEPMEFEDKWGKKCPAQFSLIFRSSQPISVSSCADLCFLDKKDLFSKLTISFWIFLFPFPIQNQDNFNQNNQIMAIIKLGKYFDIVIDNQQQLMIQVNNKLLNQQLISNQSQEQPLQNLVQEQWIIVSISYNQKNFPNRFIINLNNYPLYVTEEFIFTKQQLSQSNAKNILKIETNEQNTICTMFKITELRIWNSILSQQFQKDTYRLPLEIVAEKKKQIVMKFKSKLEKKEKDDKKNLKSFIGGFFDKQQEHTKDEQKQLQIIPFKEKDTEENLDERSVTFKQKMQKLQSTPQKQQQQESINEPDFQIEQEQQNTAFKNFDSFNTNETSQITKQNDWSNFSNFDFSVSQKEFSIAKFDQDIQKQKSINSKIFTKKEFDSNSSQKSFEQQWGIFEKGGLSGQQIKSQTSEIKTIQFDEIWNNKIEESVFSFTMNKNFSKAEEIFNMANQFLTQNYSTNINTNSIFSYQQYKTLFELKKKIANLSSNDVNQILFLEFYGTTLELQFNHRVEISLHYIKLNLFYKNYQVAKNLYQRFDLFQGQQQIMQEIASIKVQLDQILKLNTLTNNQNPQFKCLKCQNNIPLNSKFECKVCKEQFFICQNSFILSSQKEIKQCKFCKFQINTNQLKNQQDFQCFICKTENFQ